MKFLFSRAKSIFRLQTAVQKPLGALLEYPLYDVQDILEMIIEGLAGDAALLYQVFYCDLVKALSGSHFQKGFCDFVFQIFSQSHASCVLFINHSMDVRPLSSARYGRAFLYRRRNLSSHP